MSLNRTYFASLSAKIWTGGGQLDPTALLHNPVFGVIAKNFSFYVKKLHFFVLRLQSNSIKQKIRVFFVYIFFGIKLSVKLCNNVTSKLKG